MMSNVYGKISLLAFVGGIAVLALFLPSLFSFAYRQFVTAWWIYILTIYTPVSIAVTRAAFKDYRFKVNCWQCCTTLQPEIVSAALKWCLGSKLTRNELLVETDQKNCYYRCTVVLLLCQNLCGRILCVTNTFRVNMEMSGILTAVETMSELTKMVESGIVGYILSGQLFVCGNASFFKHCIDAVFWWHIFGIIILLSLLYFIIISYSMVKSVLKCTGNVQGRFTVHWSP